MFGILTLTLLQLLPNLRWRHWRGNRTIVEKKKREGRRGRGVRTKNDLESPEVFLLYFILSLTLRWLRSGCCLRYRLRHLRMEQQEHQPIQQLKT